MEKPGMLIAEQASFSASVPKPPANRRPSSVSQALRAVRDVLEAGSTGWEIQAGDLGKINLTVASNRKQRERAYRLAHNVYGESGYVRSKRDGLIVSSYDAHPDTLTLLAEDASGNAVGTISLVFDSENGLPCDELFQDEMGGLRLQGRRLIEVTRLAIARDYPRSKRLLVHLYNFVSIFARRVKGGTDFMIEVNPRHAPFYTRMLLFTPISAPRCCPRVNGAPAILLRLDLGEQAKELERVGGTQGRPKGSRRTSLYSHFHSLADEHFIAGFLESQHGPMPFEDLRYFGLNGET